MLKALILVAVVSGTSHDARVLRGIDQHCTLAALTKNLRAFVLLWPGSIFI